MMKIPYEFFEYLEHVDICGYSFQELIRFADACKRANISETDLHAFCLNCDSAYEYTMEKINEEFQKQMKKVTTVVYSRHSVV